MKKRERSDARLATRAAIWLSVFQRSQIARASEKGSGDEVPGSILEAPPGIEPGMELLQSSALPLGDGALRKSEVESQKSEVEHADGNFISWVSDNSDR